MTSVAEAAAPRWAVVVLALLLLLAAAGGVALGGEGLGIPFVLHGLALLLVCAACAWGRRSDVPAALRSGIVLSCLYLLGTWILLHLARSDRMRLGEDDPSDSFWVFPLAALQWVWLLVGGRLTWNLWSPRAAPRRT